MRMRLAIVAPATSIAALVIALTPAQALLSRGDRYAQSCSGASRCAYVGIIYTNPHTKISTLELETGRAVCPTARYALLQVGQFVVKRGKVSTDITVQGFNSTTHGVYPVTVKLKATVKSKKSVVGTLVFTTTAPDCTALSGRPLHLSLNYSRTLTGF